MSGKNWVKLIWVPGHENIKGNEKGDMLPKIKNTRALNGPEPYFGASYSSAKPATAKWLLKEHTRNWNGTEGMIHSKKFIKQFI